mgnify:CR=1 FL=1
MSLPPLVCAGRLVDRARPGVIRAPHPLPTPRSMPRPSTVMNWCPRAQGWMHFLAARARASPSCNHISPMRRRNKDELLGWVVARVNMMNDVVA